MILAQESMQNVCSCMEISSQLAWLENAFNVLKVINVPAHLLCVPEHQSQGQLFWQTPVWGVLVMEIVGPLQPPHLSVPPEQFQHQPAYNVLMLQIVQTINNASTTSVAAIATMTVLSQLGFAILQTTHAFLDARLINFADKLLALIIVIIRYVSSAFQIGSVHLVRSVSATSANNVAPVMIVYMQPLDTR
mmetsp:Transcript_11831/g.23741  ORF Transcript_11831/g.23741 Transcript_11831/m.23741 type:complete len:191 (+) Transcript_11831:2881-3453(+)